MDGSRARWAYLVGPLLLNVVGWIAIYFLVVAALPKQPEVTPVVAAPDPGKPDVLAEQARAMEAQLAKLETFTEKLAQQLDTLEKRERSRPPPEDINRRLSQAQLAKLESATARLEDELGNLRQRTHVTVDLNALVQGLRPNVSIGLLRVDPKAPGVVDVTFQMRNLGPYSTMVEATDLVLATKPMAQSGPVDGQVSPQDYTFKAIRAGALLPNEPRNHAYTIVLNNPRRLEQPLYYRMTFKSTTDPAVVSTSSRLLSGKVPEKDIHELSVSHYSHVGEVSMAQRP